MRTSALRSHLKNKHAVLGEKHLCCIQQISPHAAEKDRGQTPGKLGSTNTPVSGITACIQKQTIPQMTQPTLKETFQSTSKYRKNHSTICMLHTKLAKCQQWICSGSFHLQKQHFFGELMEYAIPKQQIPSKAYFAVKAIPQLYKTVFISDSLTALAVAIQSI